MEPAVRKLWADRQDGRPIVLSPGSEVYAWAHRAAIEESLVEVEGAADEVVFSAPGAVEVIERYFEGRPTRVVPLESVFGGNTDFVQATTLSGAMDRLREILGAGHPVSRVYLPASLFWIDRQYDLKGDRLERMAEAFPGIEVNLLAVEDEVIWSVLTLEDCMGFYDRA